GAPRRADGRRQDEGHDPDPDHQRGLGVPAPGSPGIPPLGSRSWRGGWRGRRSPRPGRQRDGAHRLNRTLGSSDAYATSAARLSRMTMIAKTSARPWTTVKSRWTIELISSWPS